MSFNLKPGMTFRTLISGGYEYVLIKSVNSKLVQYCHFVCGDNRYYQNPKGYESSFSDFYEAADNPEKVNAECFEHISKNVFNRAVLRVIFKHVNFTLSRLWSMYDIK